MKNYEKLSYYSEILNEGKSLNFDESYEIFCSIADNEVNNEEIKQFLQAINHFGIDKSLLYGAAKALNERSIKINAPNNAIDVCGTGGDNSNSLNISTSVAIILASMGVVVAKHGNKAVSSNSGSADIFSKIGIDISQDKEKVEQSLTEHNLAFIYAPLYHPALKNVAQARKELGVRTIFNFLGPLLNPAQTQYQLIGCSDKKIAKIMLEVCYLLGKKKCIIVTGMDGMDEISISSDSLIFEMGADKKIKETTFNPEKFGIKKCSKELISGKDPDYNSMQLIKLLKGQIDSKELEAYANIVALNAAMALTLKNNDKNISLAINKVKAKINSGECYSFLQKFTKNIS